MPYCSKCGNQLIEGSRFCNKCGMATDSSNSNQRETVYDGQIHKCPSCGATLESFVKNCSECGYELRGTIKTESVNEFSLKYAEADSNAQKVDLIRTFVIPNTKEDILEFVILASSNIDEGSFARSQTTVSGGVSQQEVSDAWMAKFEQAYQKANFLLQGDPELKKIEVLYEKKKKSLSSAKAKSIGGKVVKGIFGNDVVKAMFPFIALGIGFMLICVVFLGGGERKLENQVKQIESYISEGNYDAALTTAYAMSDDYSDSWSETRSSLISRIEQLRGKNLGLVRIPSSDFEDEEYSKVVSAFEKAGFTNIKTEALNDLIVGIFHSEGEVKEIEIDGQTDYKKGDFVSPEVGVIIRYHSSSD